jgi:hypothetical protein
MVVHLAKPWVQDPGPNFLVRYPSACGSADIRPEHWTVNGSLVTCAACLVMMGTDALGPPRPRR